MGAGSMVPDEEENTHASNVLVFHVWIYYVQHLLLLMYLH